MPREQTILERLRTGEEPDQRTAVENTGLLMKSIRRNIARLLNAREEHAPAQPDYGVPAPSEIVYGFPQSVTRMQRRIKSLLEKFEPRLSDVEVLHIENEDKTMLILQYQIQAKLATSSSPSWVSYLVRMDPSGRITVRR